MAVGDWHGVIPRTTAALASVSYAWLASNVCLACVIPLQSRAEVVGAILAAICILVPEIEDRLKEALPGRGRQQAAGPIAGAAVCRMFLGFQRPPALGSCLACQLGQLYR